MKLHILSALLTTLSLAGTVSAQTEVLLGGIGFDEFTTAGRTWTRLKGGSQTYADSIGNRYSDIEGGRKADGSTEPYVQRTIIYWDGTHGSSDWNTQISLGVGSLGKVANTSTVGEQFLNSANSFDDTLYSNSSTAANGVPQVTTDSALQLNIKNGFSTSISINATGYSLTQLAFSALTASADVTISLGLWNGTTTTALDVSKLISGPSMTAYAFDLSGLYLENDQIDLVLTYTAADGTLLTIDNVQILGVVYDPATGLLVIWRGGDGTWGASPASTAWTNQSGATNGAWSGGAAIFGGTAGTVTVSTADGPVTFTGAKFQTTGYTIAGGALTTETADTELSVVADATATISAPITGTGGIDKTDLGTLVLSGASTYAGATTVSAGTLFIDGNQSAATGAVSVADGATLGGSGTTGGIVTVASGGTLLGVQGRTFTMAGLVLNVTSHLDVTLGAPGASGLFHVNGDLTLDGLLDITATAGFGVGVYRLIDYTGALTDNGLDLGITPDGVPLSNLAVQTTVAHQVNLVFEAVSRNFWNGGSGTWSADPSGSSWTNFDGTDTGSWAPDVAIFQGTAGIVAVDTSFGAVVFTGIQFASDGWTVAGGVLTTDTADTALRVGDGSDEGADYTATVESVIAGSGGLNKTDLGTAILTGDNTYTGATKVTAGTLRIEGDQSAATGAVTVASGAALGGAGRTGGNVTIAGGGTLLGEAGQVLEMASLTLNSTSRLDVSLGGPDADASGVFKVNGDLVLDGLLNITATADFGPGLYRLIDYNGDLTNNGLAIGTIPDGVNTWSLSVKTDTAGQVNLFFIDPDTALPVWKGGSGVWSVDGSLGNWGDGSTTGGWQEGFAFFGGTAGTVTINATPGPVAVTAIQFAVTGYTVRGDTLTLNNANTVFRVGDGSEQGEDYTATISSVISGAGGIEKTDLGTLVLTGNNSYTGATTIAQGAIRLVNSSLSGTTVAAGAGLLGTGTIRGDLINNGLLSAGASPGTITVTGNYTQGSAGVQLVELESATSYDKLVVSGTATLGGTLAVTGLDGFVPTVGQSFEILTAAGGVTGEFANVVSDWDALSAMLRFDAVYGTNSVTVGLQQLPFAGLSGTANQQQIGAAVDAAIAAAGIDDLQDALNSLATEGDVLAALDQLSPLGYARWFDQAVYSAGSLVRSAEDRLALPPTRTPDPSTPQGDLWTELVRRESRFEGEGRATADGMVVGGDTPVGPHGKIGVFFGYTDEDIDLNNSSTTSAERFTAALYGRYEFTRCFIEGVAGAGYAMLENERSVGVPGTVGAAKSDTDSDEQFASLRVGYPMLLAGKLKLTPYAGVQYVSWNADAFEEEGAGDADLSVHAQSGDSFASRLGASVAVPFVSKSVTITPRFDLAWRHEFIDDAREVSADLGGGSFTVRGESPSTDGLIAGFGLDASFGPDITAYATVAGEWATAADKAYEARAGVQFRF